MAKKNNALKYILIGCGALIFIGVAIFGVLAYIGVKKAQEFQADFKNPEPKALEILGAEQLPEGYYAALAMDMIIMKLVILSDTPRESEDDQDPDFKERGLFYFWFRFSGNDQQDLKDYFEGKTDDPRALRDNNINIDMDEVKDRGVFEAHGNTYSYVTFRGDVNMQQGGGGQGLSTMFLVSCPTDEKLRMGIWMGTDPDPSAPIEDLDLTGTTGDLDALKAFLGNFSFCN